MKTNYHTHSTFCDGIGHPEEYIKAAIEKNFDTLGFSSHGILPFVNPYALTKEKINKYKNAILELKEKYKKSIEIQLGLEIDYTNNKIITENFDKNQWNYIIASVHIIIADNKYYEIDGSEQTLKEILNIKYQNNVEELVKDYYFNLRNLIKNEKFDILGHFDLIKKRNNNFIFFDENSSWYKNEVIKTLDTLAENPHILEINTGGLSRKTINTIYPSPWILNLCRDRDIKLVLNSDAHQPDHIDFYFKEAKDLIKGAGYSNLMHFTNGEWISKRIK